FSVLMPPGSYTVRLTVDGQTLSQPLEVRKDPNSSATDHDIRASNALLLDLQRDIEATAQMLNRIESARQQIQRLTSTPDVRAAADSLEQKLIAVEQNIVDLRLSGRGQDEVRWPVMLGGRLNYLAGGVGASDFTPTAQQREVQQLLAKQVVSTRAELDRVMQMDLMAFNRLLTAKGMRPIE
ncbi:MAG: hypothetical protein ABIW94_09400, partial [Gemmatimonadaceae bacterium]